MRSARFLARPTPNADGNFQPKTSRVFCARHGPRRHAGGIHRGAPRGSSAPPVRSTRAPRGCEGESARAREHLFRARRGRVSARRRRRPRLARRRRVRRRLVRRLGPKSNPRPGVCAGTTGRWSFLFPPPAHPTANWAGRTSPGLEQQRQGAWCSRPVASSCQHPTPRFAAAQQGRFPRFGRRARPPCGGSSVGGCVQREKRERWSPRAGGGRGVGGGYARRFRCAASWSTLLLHTAAATAVAALPATSAATRSGGGCACGWRGGGCQGVLHSAPTAPLLVRRQPNASVRLLMEQGSQISVEKHP